mmetsp:Transcript_17698/g.31218  ORF Transcript_17698/g.31218 Transcript_17698/m.31218 type:complete len:406 (+) Transcript_17698:294-1511(+)
MSLAEALIEEPLSESEAVVQSFKGRHRLKVSQFSSHLRHPQTSDSNCTKSAVFSVGGRQFELLLFLKTDGKRKTDYLSVYVRFLGPQAQCQASWSLSCINQLDATKTLSKGWDKGDERNEFNSGRHWGWSKFIKRSKVLDPEEGFLVNDTLVLEVTLVVVGQKEVLRRDTPDPINTLSLDLQKLQQSEEFADVVFSLDNGMTKLKAHRQILAARSEVMARMLCGEFKEGHRPAEMEEESRVCTSKNKSSSMFEVEIEDISGDTFRHVLTYLYTGELGSAGNAKTDSTPAVPDGGSRKRKASWMSSKKTEAVSELLIELLMAADKYDLKGLREICVAKLKRKIDKTTVVDILKASDLCNLESLKACCMQHISSYGVNIGDEMLSDLPQNVLVELLKFTLLHKQGNP